MRTIVKATSLRLVLVAGAFVLSSGISAHAQNAKLDVTPGWFTFDPLRQGTVQRKGPNPLDRLKLKYHLKGVKPNATYTVGFDIFDAAGQGVSLFGVQRFTRLTQTQEGNTATTDVFIVGEFDTDANGEGGDATEEADWDGDGRSKHNLSLAGVPPGTYKLQYFYSEKKPTCCPVSYRTGRVFAGDFDTITIR